MVGLIRWFVIAVLVATAAFILVRPSKYVRKPPAGVTVIQYWEKWTGEESRQMQIIVDDFNNSVGKEKNIFVEYISMSAIDQKTLVATAAGVPPDVAGMWDPQIAQFAAMNALEPLDDLAAEYGITRDYYKPVYWRGLTYQGKLYGLISTPGSIVMHYNKAAFEDSADKLRAAGLDPSIPPRTIAELDRYAEQLTIFEDAAKTRIKRSGHLPMEPGWYLALFPNWFGGSAFDEATQSLTLERPENIRAFDWVASYSRKYGKEAFDQFRAGLGNFASAQNAFLARTVAIEQQGPWMSNFIEKFAPDMNRWRVPPEKLKRERDFDSLKTGMAERDVIALLGEPMKTDGSAATWDAGIKTITCTFDADRKLSAATAQLLPAKERQAFCEWGVAPFPNAVSPDKIIAYCPFDTLVIPRGSKHKREAFEFIAYVNRQEVMEKLCSMHCKNSPLAKTSQAFIDNHGNPYIQVFEDAANSPDAFCLPAVPIWPEIAEELTNVGQQSYLLVRTPEASLKNAATRLEERWSYFRRVQTERAGR